MDLVKDFMTKMPKSISRETTVKKAADIAKTKISEVMTEDPLIVGPDEDIQQILISMKGRGISSVIVKGTEDQAWGIFTSTDAIAYLTQKDAKH